jgi:serine/threonine-protein kinase
LPRGAQLQNGAFEIETLMGQGGRGLTYRGRDVALRRAVAIKEFFPPGSARDGERITAPPAMSEAEFIAARENFGRGASALARFNDEGIVRVFRVFEESDSIYLVMEFLEGQILARKQSWGALPIDETLRIGMRIAQALGVIHDARMLHRAIAPANIFLTQGGRAVLIDFVAAAGISPPHAGALKTSGYIAPECFEDTDAPGPAVDIYGLGATLYRALTGSAPTPALERLAGKDLPLPEKINSQVSVELSRVILQALELPPEKRVPSAREFARTLKDASAPRFSLAPAVSPHARRTPGMPAPRTPAAPPPGASVAPVALPPTPPSSPAATVSLPPVSAPPASQEKTTSTEIAGAGSTPAPSRAAPPNVPRSTPVPAPGTQLCPHCGMPMPAVMSRCPHCRQLKTASPDPDSGTFREWHRNENTRIGLGWALAIGFALLILLSMWRGCESLGLKPERIPRQEYGLIQAGSTLMPGSVSGRERKSGTARIAKRAGFGYNFSRCIFCGDNSFMCP